MPPKPNLLTREKKEELITQLDTEILELKESRLKLNDKQAELRESLKKQKPEEIREAEKKRKALLDEKKERVQKLKELNQEKQQVKDKMGSFDDQKPHKLKKQEVSGQVPQDEEELNRMVAYWENVLNTKSLKAKEEEDVLKKLDHLEGLRASIGDYSNISKEILNLRKQLQSVKTHIQERKKSLERVNKGIDENTALVDGF